MAKRSPITGAVRVEERLPRELTDEELVQCGLTQSNLLEEVNELKEALADHRKNVMALISQKLLQVREIGTKIRTRHVYEIRTAFRKVAGNTVHYFDEDGQEIHSKEASSADLQISMFTEKQGEFEEPTLET